MNPRRLVCVIVLGCAALAAGTAWGQAAAKKPLAAGEREKLLAELASGESARQTAALERLAAAAADDDRADVARAVAPLLSSGDATLQVKAGWALAGWVTPAAVPALTAAAGTSREELAKPVFLGLANAATEEAAQAAAAHTGDWPVLAVAALQRMGPVAEQAAIDLTYSSDIFEQAAACRVLTKIGGPRCVRAVKPLSTSGVPLVRNDALAALAALEKRLGREGIAKALASPPPAPTRRVAPPPAMPPVASPPTAPPPALTPAPPAQPSPAAPPDPPAAPTGSEYRVWTDVTGKHAIEARLEKVEGDKVVLRKADDTLIEIALTQLSEADRAFLAGDRSPETLAAAAKNNPLMVGGTGGWEFLSVEPRGDRPLLGLRYRLGSWGREQVIAHVESVFEKRGGGDQVVMARPGYAVGALNVQAGELVNAVQVVFMRIKSPKRLDPADSYTSEWIGYPNDKPVRTVGGTGAAALGVFGRHGAVVNAIGLVFPTRKRSTL